MKRCDRAASVTAVRRGDYGSLNDAAMFLEALKIPKAGAGVVNLRGDLASTIENTLIPIKLNTIHTNPRSPAIWNTPSLAVRLPRPLFISLKMSGLGLTVAKQSH